MVSGLILSLIKFNGSLNSEWITISRGALLFILIVLHPFPVRSFDIGGKP